jgi:hypothetical protein
MPVRDTAQLREVVGKAVHEVKVTDAHTHLYPPRFGSSGGSASPALLWGVDELITYHYLIAETFRWTDMPYDDYWQLSKQAQADLIWRTLFVENSPVAESCRGVLTALQKLGLDTGSRDLESYRHHFEGMAVEEYVDRVFELSGVKEVVMTNDPFDEGEREVWLKGPPRDPRFHAALRLDPLLNAWESNWEKLASWEYAVSGKLTAATLDEVRRFLREWAERMGAVYMAVSLPPTFVMPDESLRGVLIKECVLPVCEELNRPFAMMMGVKKLANPRLQLAGDSVGRASVEAVEYLCATYPRSKFLVTMLSRENQHELCVAARKFRNLMPFGCWWFLNNPSLVDEITRMRLELLGLSFIPQHSDARVLDQLLYKWDHSRRVIADALFDKYHDLMATGWTMEEWEIKRDVEKLFGGNFWSFVKRKL